MSYEIEARARGAMLYLNNELLAPGQRIGTGTLGGALHVFTFEDGEEDNGRLQTAIDALPDYAELLMSSEGNYYINSPIRMRDKVGLAGTGFATVLRADPLFVGGPLVIIGADQDAHDHGAAIMDDADFSYEFKAATPYHFMPLGDAGLYPEDWTQLSVEMAFSINAVSDAVFFACGGTFIPGTNTLQIYMGWNPDFQRLFVWVWIGGVLKVLTTTSTFHADMGTRHMLAVEYDGATVRLFIDGVIEDSAAASGTFTSNPWDIWNIGGVLGGSFPVGEIITSSAQFNMGWFRVCDTAQHTSNYTVSWTTPDPVVGERCAVVCKSANESGDLIKLRMLPNHWAWMQTRRAPAFDYLETNFVRIHDLEIRGGSAVAGSLCTAVQVFYSPRTTIERVGFRECQGIECVGNSFFSRYGDLHGGGGRFAHVLNGGLVTLSGKIEVDGSKVALSLAGGIVADTIHCSNYEVIGVWMQGVAGHFSSLGVSDEFLSPGVDPLYGLLISTPGSGANALEIASLGVDIISSDTTKPIGIASGGASAQTTIKITGGLNVPGLTTPPAQAIYFNNPTLTDPIHVNLRDPSGVPISNNPEKIITPSGPAGRATLTDADATITARQAREFDLAGVTLTGNRVVTLDDEITAGVAPDDGTVITFYANCTFAGFSVTIDNHDGADLHVFSAAGQRSFRWGASAGDWSMVEAA